MPRINAIRRSLESHPATKRPSSTALRVGMGIEYSARVRVALLHQNFCADWSGIPEEHKSGPPKIMPYEGALFFGFTSTNFRCIRHLRLSPCRFFSASVVCGGFRMATGSEGPRQGRRLCPAPEGAKRLYGDRDCGIKPNSREAAHRSGALRGGVAPLGWVTEDRVLCGLKSGKGHLPSPFHCVIMCTQ